MTLSEILGTVIALLLSVILVLGFVVKIERDQVLLARSDIATCELVNKGWQEQEKENNDKLQKILRENEELNAKAKAAVDQASAAMVKSQALSNKLKAVKAAPQDCEAAGALINRYLGGSP